MKISNKIQRTLLVLTLSFLLLGNPSVFAQSSAVQDIDISDSNFRLVVCDGPDLSGIKKSTTIKFNGQQVTVGNGQNPPGYIPCNFAGLMMQIQRIINVAVIVGVLAAIFSFTYAGFIYITEGSNPGKRADASKMFKNVAIGFIIMLSAWLIVYQILDWLADPKFAALLGL